MEDAPKEFYEKYFGNTDCDAYELLAIEWSSGVLMQLVGIAGGRLTHDDFEKQNGLLLAILLLSLLLL